MKARELGDPRKVIDRIGEFERGSLKFLEELAELLGKYGYALTPVDGDTLAVIDNEPLEELGEGPKVTLGVRLTLVEEGNAVAISDVEFME